MTTATDANEILMGSGGRTAKFTQHGEQVWGEIVSLDARQQTAFESSELLYWPDGAPRMQVVVTLQTELQDDADDDGLRRLYAKGAMTAAIRKAVTQANARGLTTGGRLLVRYVSDAAPKRPGMSGEKQYFAKYEPPAATVVIPEDGGDDAPPPNDEDLPF